MIINIHTEPRFYDSRNINIIINVLGYNSNIDIIDELQTKLTQKCIEYVDNENKKTIKVLKVNDININRFTVEIPNFVIVKFIDEILLSQNINAEYFYLDLDARLAMSYGRYSNLTYEDVEIDIQNDRNITNEYNKYMEERLFCCDIELIDKQLGYGVIE